MKGNEELKDVPVPVLVSWSTFFFSLEAEVLEDESDAVVGELCCCLAMVDTALRKRGELIEIPGINE